MKLYTIKLLMLPSEHGNDVYLSLQWLRIDKQFTVRGSQLFKRDVLIPFTLPSVCLYVWNIHNRSLSKNSSSHQTKPPGTWISDHIAFNFSRIDFMFPKLLAAFIVGIYKMICYITYCFNRGSWEKFLKNWRIRKYLVCIFWTV